MFDQNKKFKFNPDLSSVLSNHMSRYSLVRATAKRAREISEEAEEDGIILMQILDAIYKSAEIGHEVVIG